MILYKIEQVMEGNLECCVCNIITNIRKDKKRCRPAKVAPFSDREEANSAKIRRLSLLSTVIRVSCLGAPQEQGNGINKEDCSESSIHRSCKSIEPVPTLRRYENLSKSTTEWRWSFNS